MKTKYQIFFQWNINFFLRKFCFSYILDLAKIVRALQILSQKFTENIGT